VWSAILLAPNICRRVGALPNAAAAARGAERARTDEAETGRFAFARHWSDTRPIDGEIRANLTQHERLAEFDRPAG